MSADGPEDSPSPSSSQQPADTRAMVAIDLGAESCRVSLLRWIAGRPRVEIVHRFANGPVQTGEKIRWNLEKISEGVEQGLRLCADIAIEGIASIASDGWAVDYVRLDANGRPKAAPFCYRDERTVAAETAAHQHISREELYALTGLQRLRFNTIYQLYADNMAGMDASMPWVNLPEYVLYTLGGRRVAEYTNATHTGLVDLRTRAWCSQVFQTLGLDERAAPELVAPGTIVGRLRGALSELPPFVDTRLIAPACHDTASAIAGIPDAGGDWAYISSGTWSLVGALLEKPCNSSDAYENDFTNLGAAGGRTCFHKNVNGMWLIRQCMEKWAEMGRAWNVAELVAKAEGVPPPAALLDVDEPDLMLPGGMPARINQQRQRAGLSALDESPDKAPEFASLIFHSLAARYAKVLHQLASITGKELHRIYIVGGGSRNALLNRLTEQASGLKVSCGQVESSTIGNFAVQLAALQAARDSANGPTVAEVGRWAKALEHCMAQ
jgi:rhamnulokinase